MLDRDMAARVIGRIWTSTQLLEDFHAICALGGRLSGTASERAAVAFLSRRLAEAMGSAVTHEPIPYRGWTRGPSRVVAGGRDYHAEALGRSPATPEGGLRAKLLDLGRGTPAEIAAAGSRVRGAIL